MRAEPFLTTTGTAFDTAPLRATTVPLPARARAVNVVRPPVAGFRRPGLREPSDQRIGVVTRLPNASRAVAANTFVRSAVSDAAAGETARDARAAGRTLTVCWAGGWPARLAETVGAPASVSW